MLDAYHEIWNANYGNRKLRIGCDASLEQAGSICATATPQANLENDGLAANLAN